MAEYKEHGLNSKTPSYLWHYIKQPLLSLLSKDKNNCILDRAVAMATL